MEVIKLLLIVSPFLPAAFKDNTHAARGRSQRSQDSPPSHTIPELLRYSLTKGTGPVPLIFLSYLVTREQKETVPKPSDPQGQ